MGKRLLEPASAGFSGKGFNQAPGPGGLKPSLEKALKRPSGDVGEAADPGVNTGSNTLRARLLKRPPGKGHIATIVSVRSLRIETSNIFG